MTKNKKQDLMDARGILSEHLDEAIKDWNKKAEWAFRLAIEAIDEKIKREA